MSVRRRAIYKRVVRERNELKRENRLLQKEIEGCYADIDRLMVEYCPNEMTEGQKQRYAAAQVPITPEKQAEIDAAVQAFEADLTEAESITT